ncbi:unnamed protein product [Absidia cylindrospora]
MVNFLEQNPAFVNPWDSQKTYSNAPCDLGIGDDLKSILPYRRHSLALEQPFTRNNNDRQGSWSSSISSSSSNSTDLFGSIWNNPNSNSNNRHHQFANGGNTATSPSFYSSSSSMTRSFPLTQDALPRPPPLRRFSLAPVAYETTQDQANALSSVPEESFQSYRRHSLAGPLVSSTSSSAAAAAAAHSASLLSPDYYLSTSNYQYPPPSPLTYPQMNYTGATMMRHASSLNNTTTSCSTPTVLTPMEEENSLLPFELLESVDASQGQQQQHHHHHQQQQSSLSWCMVEFKAGRAEIYYSKSPVSQDDWVIVEADRGRDLGKVVAKDLPLDQVQLLLAATSNSPTTATLMGTTDNVHHSSSSSALLLDHPPSPSSSLSSSSSSSSSSSAAAPLPKQICRLATPSEITLLVTKRHDEQKALLICQTKSKQKNLLMDIVDAEYQWDRRKLTFYFIAERRVDFRELVRDLFKIYKTRIWMCSVNSVGKKNMNSSK